MITKTVLVSLIIMLATLVDGSLYESQTRAPVVAKPMERIKLKLAAEYKKNHLEDLSSDGKLMLFYQTSNSIRSFTFPSDGAPKADQPPTNDDILRVVDRESGREIGRIGIYEFPYSAQFIPGTTQVFYSEGNAFPKRGTREKLWNPASGESLVYLDSSEVLQANESFSYITAISSQKAIGAVWQKNTGGELLLMLALPSYGRTTIGPVSPSTPEARIAGNGKVLGAYSSVRGQIAYKTMHEEVIIIRDTSTLQIVKQIKPSSGLILGDDPIYTSDGKYLLVVASNTTYDMAETQRYLLFYDTTNYEITKKLEVTSWKPPYLGDEVAMNSNYLGKMAISPDSRMAAVGYTRKKKNIFSTTEQAEIVLYDLLTGEELGRAAHPAIRQKRDDPFAATIGKLAFTPDGKYLLSSTHDTRIWEIISNEVDH